MAKLINQSKNIELSHNVIEAKTFYQRLKGLLGRDGLPVRECLLFRRTNSIHTFMMKFNLDVIFLDRKDRVKSIHLNVKPGRIILPIWGAWTALEFASGSIQPNQVSVGDQLDVSA